MKYDGKKTLLTELAKRVKTLREEKGLTQEECLNDTGISFSRIEQGKRDISFTTLHKICIYFKITLNEFFEGYFNSMDSK